ncbi:MAG: phosphotransferase [Deltaproteobacteria bacterium]|nr:phosphotransferase [Deltaproteobacteria bacterium]
MKPLIHFLLQHLPSLTGYTGRLRIKALKGDGSDRKVFRLFAGERTFICVSHPNGRQGIPSENDSFAYIAGHLRSKGLPAPLIQACDPGRGLFLMEDFGDFSLESVIKRIKEPRLIKRVYQTILKLLIKIQIEGARDFDARYCYDTPVFDSRFTWERESRYFIDAFLKGYLGWKTVPSSVEKELKSLAWAVDQEKHRLFLYRDFQSRNIMIWSGGIGLIDFQGGRMGPPQYDLASVLIDPYVSIPLNIQDELIDFYLQELSNRLPVRAKTFRENYEIIAFQRNLQILGAYAFLSRVKGKSYFEEYIPASLTTLKRRVAGPTFRPFKEVRRLVKEL